MAEEKKKTKETKEKKEKFVLIPRVTEKAVVGEGQGVFTFTLSGLANKKEIAVRVQRDFKIKPVKIRVVKLPRKSVIVMGRRGNRGGAVKALVYLKPGDKITHSGSDKKK